MLANPRPVCLGLLQLRPCLVPTWRGWAGLLLGGAVLLAVLVQGTFPFLAVNDSKPGGALIVEGWVPDHALAEAMAEFHRQPYTAFLVSGGPIDKGLPLAEYGTWAEVGAATAVKLGFPAAQVRAVPAPPVLQDRTYASAVAVRDWLRAQGRMPAQINVVSLGAHARRTRVLYEAAFAGAAEVGVLAVDDPGYDGQRWWTSSQGFRVVTGELIAYAYARLLFRPRPEAASGTPAPAAAAALP